MKSIVKPPDKRPGKDKNPAEPAGKERLRDPQDVSGGKEGESSTKPSEEEVISHWNNPVTNQDEQEKITNNGGDDIPVANN